MDQHLHPRWAPQHDRVDPADALAAPASATTQPLEVEDVVDLIAELRLLRRLRAA